MYAMAAACAVGMNAVEPMSWSEPVAHRVELAGVAAAVPVPVPELAVLADALLAVLLAVLPGVLLPAPVAGHPDREVARMRAPGTMRRAARRPLT